MELFSDGVKRNIDRKIRVDKFGVIHVKQETELQVKAVPMTTRGLNYNPNQLVIEVVGGPIFFQSYGVTVARIEGNNIALDKRYWKYSPTTSKYRNQFLQIDTKETKKRIEAGIIELIDLN